MATNDVPRSDRRRISVGLIGRAEQAKLTGLPVPPDGDIAIGLALALRRLLADKESATRASDAAAFAADVLEATLVRQVANEEKLACRQGCAWCCKSIVTISAPEILRIASHIRSRGADAVATVLDRATVRHGLALEDLLRQKLDCPLLADNGCTVYGVRPLSCRQLFSLSAEACEAAMVTGSEDVPLLVEPMQLGELVRTMLFAAMRAEGHREIAYDMTEGLVIALNSPSAEARWVAGEDVFAGVRTGTRPPRAEAATERIVEVLRQLEY